MATYALSNIDNYKPDLNLKSHVIFTRYLGLITEYLIQCVDNIHLRNIDYYRYVILKGLQTISHVFKFLLLYTKNLELTYHHCQKSAYYYIEFIGQIGDDNHSFLQLNSKDAILFVYKKTIFEVDQNFRKEFAAPEHKGSIITNLELLIGTYSDIFKHVLNNCEITADDKTNVIKSLDPQMVAISKQLLNLSLHISESEYGTRLEVINWFCNNISVSSDKIILYMESFTKKLRKKNILIATLQQKFLNKYNQTKLNTISISKYITWLFNST